MIRKNNMKEDFYKQLEYYLNDELSLKDLIYNFKILDRERRIEKCTPLLNEIDPRLKALFDQLKHNVEELTDLRYAGCYNSLENTNADFKNYVLRFEDNYRNAVDISLGRFYSMGSGKNETYTKYNDKDNILVFGCETPSCHYTGGELNIDDENVFMDSLSKIIYFRYQDDEKLQVFLENFGKVSNEDLYNILNEYDNY